MTVSRIVTAYHLRQRVLAAQSATAVATLWTDVGVEDLDATWRSGVAGMVTALAAALAASASVADEYVDRSLDEQGIRSDREARVRPQAFAQRTADGRELVAMMALPLIAVKVRIARGVEPALALEQSRRDAGRLAATEVADTGRASVQTSMTAQPTATGFVRVTRGSSTCDRCRSLTNQVYGWSADFPRHPRCDCVAAVTNTRRGESLTVDAPPARQAGMASVADMSRRSGGRDAPDQIIADADSRAAAIAALRRERYLT